jgi:hypothetical protein
MRADHSSVGGPEGATALPIPSAWTEDRLPLWLRFSVGFMAVLAGGMAAEAVWLAVAGEPLSGVALAGASLYLGHVVALGKRFLGRPRQRSSRMGTLTSASDGATGVTFTYSAWPYYLITAVLVMSDLVASTVGLGAALSATVLGAVVAIAVGILVLITAWVLVTMLRLAPGKVVLSPAGVDHRSLTSSYFVPWHAIIAISARWFGTPVIAVLAMPSPDSRVRRYLGRFRSGEVQFLPIMVIRGAWLATSPTVVYHALSFYQSHPELRTELDTPDAVDRIRNGKAVGRSES